MLISFGFVCLFLLYGFIFNFPGEDVDSSNDHCLLLLGKTCLLHIIMSLKLLWVLFLERKDVGFEISVSLFFI